jgi:hypothetical protein
MPRQELWLRCSTTEEADALRHSLFDRQRISQLASIPDNPFKCVKLPCSSASDLATERAIETVAAAAAPTALSRDGGGRELFGWLPLVDDKGGALRVRFASAAEAQQEAALLADYLECALLPRGGGVSTSSGGGCGDDGGGGVSDGRSAGCTSENEGDVLCCLQRCGAPHMTDASMRFVREYLDLRNSF